MTIKVCLSRLNHDHVSNGMQTVFVAKMGFLWATVGSSSADVFVDISYFLCRTIFSPSGQVNFFSRQWSISPVEPAVEYSSSIKWSSTDRRQTVYCRHLGSSIFLKVIDWRPNINQGATGLTDDWTYTDR